MPVVEPEKLTQIGDFPSPTVLDVFNFEGLLDGNGFPYTAFSPSNYHPDGPSMELGHYPSDDITERRQREGIVNTTERRNAQVLFGEAMFLLADVRSAYETTIKNHEGPLTNSDVFKIVHAGIEYPRYLFWAPNQSVANGKVPPHALLLSRALRGMHSLMQGMAWGSPPSMEHRQEFISSDFSAESTIDHLLQEHGLEGRHLVCAGHWSMITTMVEATGGKNRKPSGIRTATDSFVTHELFDFSKSLRTVWDNLYPLTEAVLKLDRQLADGEVSGPEKEDELRRSIAAVEDIAKMANLVIGTVVQSDSVTRTINIEEIVERWYEYAARGDRQEEELRAAVDEFKKRNKK